MVHSGTADPKRETVGGRNTCILFTLALFPPRSRCVAAASAASAAAVLLTFDFFFPPLCFLQKRAASKHKQADSSISFCAAVSSYYASILDREVIIPHDKGRSPADHALGLHLEISAPIILIKKV